VDNLQTQLESLRTQRDDSIDVNKKLLTKCNQLTERIAEYQKSYVANKSKQLGIDPSLVSQHINNGTTITQINKLIEDVQRTKDRYAKLPISESIPTGVLIDSSKKQVQDEEMDKLTSFVEKLASGR
jgi:outer membrane protein OmpA-like peptidoglycan-associated protein